MINLIKSMETVKIYLGIDWGKSKIGVAIGNDQSNTAVPLEVAKNFTELQSLINKEKPDVLVLGQPIKLSGNKDFLQEFNVFVEKLNGLNLPIEIIDERLTTKIADKLPGNKKEKAAQDAVAAMLILQSYFDQQNNLKTNK